MRLRSIFISQYKNLRNFSPDFDGYSFLDVFVGKNGSGKSNLFEALIEIFRHLVEFGGSENAISFDYRIRYEIDGQETSIEWTNEQLTVDGRGRRTLGRTPLPDNILIYYSGHNSTVKDLVERYETAFRRRIRGANLKESRRFLGIGPEYKSLLLTVLLAQPEGNTAREFVRRKLGIERLGLAVPGSNETTEPVIRLTLQRPEYAKDKREFDIDANDESDRYWKAEGITKEFLDSLTRCVESTPGNLTVNQGYFASDDRYVLYISIGKLQIEFREFGAQGLFRQFDNLRTLGMLSDISVPLKLVAGADGDIGFFSDGQFQAVYIYAIAEIFKDRNCLTLLDEPDAFLHPEWQFEFLKQVIEITDTAAKSNHVLMSSHSAATLISHEQRKVKFFDIRENAVNCYELPKAIAIKKLSSDLNSLL
jgi:predicted ATPase